MSEELHDTKLNIEKENEIKFSFSFKWVLAVSIGLTGLISLAGLIFFISSFSDDVLKKGTNNFLYHTLYYISIALFFIALVNIALKKRPFTKILVWSTYSIGLIFVISSMVFPHIKGYQCSGFVIFSTGNFTLFDGTLLLFGLLGILFSRLINYGFLYQSNSDMTI